MIDERVKCLLWKKTVKKDDLYQGIQNELTHNGIGMECIYEEVGQMKQERQKVNGVETK